jgi:pentatricopeptide repeat protein
MQGYIEHGHAVEALQSYELMQYEGLCPDEMTFVCVLKACGEIRDCDSGRAIHMKFLNGGMHEELIVIASALVDMYAKCGALTEAKEAFDTILHHNLVLWTAIISAYAQHRHGEEALMCYGQMQQEGFLPDSACFTCIAKACASMKALRKGAAIHVEMVEAGWLQKDAFIGTSMVDMYASCGSVAEARKVFDDLPAPNVASWTSLMAGYAQSEQGREESSRCFQQMQQEGIPPNLVTYICVLKECGANRMVEEA